jgi:hypothetical protein
MLAERTPWDNRAHMARVTRGDPPGSARTPRNAFEVLDDLIG